MSRQQTVELSVEDVIEAWVSRTNQMRVAVGEGDGSELNLSHVLLKFLAQGEPISAAKLAAAIDLPLAEVEEAFTLMKQQGAEFDEAGHLIGAALTLRPTPHQFQLGERTLYTWCALDAIFIPGLVGETAVVTSTCPITQKTIQLTVTPDGVTSYQPSSTVLSITIPGVSCSISCQSDCADDAPQTGPQSDACSQMFFFHNANAAEQWVVDHLGVAILTVDEAWQLAKANWLDRYR